MGDKAREYKRTTIRRLDTLSANECYAPTCTKNLIAEDEKTIISKICHIEAASKNGPRYNPNMSDDERRDFNNLILLCDEHHNIIDNKENESIYPVVLLREWKINHESKLLYKHLSQNSSLLNQAIMALADIELEESEIDNDTKSYAIDNKIAYNNIQENFYLIEEYKAYSGKIDLLYSELEKSGTFKKEKLLKIIRVTYLKLKGRYVTDRNHELHMIREHSDDIINDMQEFLLSEVDKMNINEDAIIAIPIIMVDAFMRCKILEKPL